MGRLVEVAVLIEGYVNQSIQRQSDRQSSSKALVAASSETPMMKILSFVPGPSWIDEQ